jgi:1A family penicillin-binding protein
MAEGPADSVPSAPPTGSQSLAAGRAFLAALGSDLTTVGRWLARFWHHVAGHLDALGYRLSDALSRPRPIQTRARAAASRPRPTRPSPFQRAIAGLARGAVFGAVVGALAVAGAMLWALHDLPAEKPIGGSAPSLLLETRDGAPLGRVGPLRTADAKRADFPDVLTNALISIEDRHFYSHWGFDPQGILRALQRNVAAGTIVEGGSTITQQLVKLRILGHERTVPHKLREALIATWVDVHLGKDEILTRYLNSVYLGNGVYGMTAAARFYFDKRPSELTLPQAALLAGLIRAPSRNNPIDNLGAAQARAAVVIDAMRETGAIDAQAAADAKAHPATPHLSTRVARSGSWFADWIGKEAAGVTGASAGSMRVRTTLDPGLQKLAEQAVAAVLDKEGARRHASQAALVAMRPDGAVVAMVGGRDYRASQFNRAVSAQRQPGSSFKLFVYLAALRNGYSLDDTIDASPIDIKGWEPDNYGDRQYGRVPLAQAFAQSINTAAARLGQQVGLDNVIAAARDLGVTSALPKVPSLPLGTAELNLLELTAAYAAVRADKMPIKPWGISGLGAEGQPRLQSMGAPIAATKSLGPYREPLLELLEDVVQYGTGRAAALDGFSAGKTGTSQRYRDAWFIGFTDALIVGVWVGNDDRTPMDRVTGGSLPAAIWKRFMTSAQTVVARDEEAPIEPAQPVDGAPAAAEPTPPAQVPTEQAPAQQASAEPTQQARQCDFAACGRYRSFRASDCTYQPYGSFMRQSCARDETPRRAEAPAAPVAPASQPRTWWGAPAAARCNIDACASTYSSFDPADCSYQPFDGGPRRMCGK